MKPYYYVYRVGHSSPTVKHPDLETAANESTRLAALHPGSSFEILQCLATTRTVNPQTFWMEGVIPPHMCALHRILDDTCGICGSDLKDK